MERRTKHNGSNHTKKHTPTLKHRHRRHPRSRHDKHTKTKTANTKQERKPTKNKNNHKTMKKKKTTKKLTEYGIKNPIKKKKRKATNTRQWNKWLFRNRKKTRSIIKYLK